MILLECCWQSAICKIPCLCWGVIGLVALYLVLKYIVQPWIANCHERKTKDHAFEREKYWHSQKEQSREKELRGKIAELEKELQAEINSREDKLKQERLQMEHDYYKKIVDDFYNKENK